MIGTPGGSRIVTSVFQVLHGLARLSAASSRSGGRRRIHHQLLPPDTLFEEPYAGLTAAVRAQLEARGYHIVNQGWNGDIQAITCAADQCQAAADPRGRGVALVLAAKH